MVVEATRTILEEPANEVVAGIGEGPVPGAAPWTDRRGPDEVDPHLPSLTAAVAAVWPVIGPFLLDRARAGDASAPEPLSPPRAPPAAPSADGKRISCVRLCGKTTPDCRKVMLD